MFFGKEAIKTAPGHPLRGIQAIILAGHGSHNKLHPLCEEGNVPKALLPVAGKPLIYYQLRWLEEAQVGDITILCEESKNMGESHSKSERNWVRQKIGDYISKVYEGSGETKIRVHQVASDGGGTADTLRAAKDKIKTDFIVLTCDLITDMPPQNIVDIHRVQNPTVTALFYDYAKFTSGAERVIKDDHDDLEYIGIDMTNNRLAMLKTRSDISEELPVRTSMMQRFPRTRIHTNLRNAQAFIFKRWVIDLIAKDKAISSIREDLLPLLVECQYRPSIVKREDIEKLSSDSFLKDAKDLSTTSSRGVDVQDDFVRCIAVVCKDGYCARADTIWAYGEINRHLAKHLNEQRIATSADVSSRTQIGPDSMIGEGSKMGERCSVKKSVIGSHCTIGKNVQISRSIIMDYVVIEDNVKLEGTVVCNNAKVQEKSVLRDCEVAASFHIPKDTIGKSECYDSLYEA